MQIQKITIGRLFNLGSYEHVRYEISVDVPQGESARDALLGLEKILSSLAPERKACVHTRADLDREAHRIGLMRVDLEKLSADEFLRRYGHFEGTPSEYVERCHAMHLENVAKREAYERRASRARELLDSLGGAAQWKDAKLDWEFEDQDDF